MKVSELKPGQFFEHLDLRWLCVWHGGKVAWCGLKGNPMLAAIDHDTEVTTLAVTGWDDEPQSEPASISKELNIDAGTEQFELARALHRVVRAMHDGHCPKCGHLASSMEFEPSEGYHCCPNCEFAITKEESDEALAMFLPYMQKNYDKFVAWQLHGRFIKPAKPTPAPLQLREGVEKAEGADWVVIEKPPLDYMIKEGYEFRYALDDDDWRPLDCVGKTLHEYWGWTRPEPDFEIRFRRQPFEPIAEVPPPVEPVQPKQFKAGDWLYCTNENSWYCGQVLECRGYSPRTKAVAVMLPDGELSAMRDWELRHATPAEVAEHLLIYKQVDSKPTEADIRKFSWCVDTWLSMQKGDN